MCMYVCIYCVHNSSLSWSLGQIGKCFLSSNKFKSRKSSTLVLMLAPPVTFLRSFLFLRYCCHCVVTILYERGPIWLILATLAGFHLPTLSSSVPSLPYQGVSTVLHFSYNTVFVYFTVSESLFVLFWGCCFRF